MADGTTLQEIDAGANACSVEWCPISGLESYVACSTYLLDNPSPFATTGGPDPDEAAAASSTLGVREDDAAAEANVVAGTGLGQTRTGTIVMHRVRGGAWRTDSCAEFEQIRLFLSTCQVVVRRSCVYCTLGTKAYWY